MAIAKRQFFAALLLLLFTASTSANAAGGFKGGEVNRPHETKSDFQRHVEEQYKAQDAEIRAAQEKLEQIEAERAEAERKRQEADRLEDAKNNWGPSDPKAKYYGIFDGLDTWRARAALRRYLNSDPVAAQIKIAKWRFAEPPKLHEIGDALRLSQMRLPGDLELGLFLDASVFGKEAKDIRAAWTLPKPISSMPKDIDKALSRRAGQTWIVIGHVEGNDFVMRNAAGREDRLSIPDLMRKSAVYNVLVIPIGCNTADAKAPSGFINAVGTKKVREFVLTLSRADVTIGNLMTGLQAIGEFRVKLRDFLDQLDIEIIDPANGEQISHVKIPYPAYVNGTNDLTGSVTAQSQNLSPWASIDWWTAILKSPLFYLTLTGALAAISATVRPVLLGRNMIAENSMISKALGLPATTIILSARLVGLAFELIVLLLSLIFRSIPYIFMAAILAMCIAMVIFAPLIIVVILVAGTISMVFGLNNES